MSRQVNFDTHLRGQEVSCGLTINPPDLDAGITGWQIDEISLTDKVGILLDWELTDEELDQLYLEMPDPEDDQFDYEEKENDAT